MNSNFENDKEAAFEAELFNSLKSYGYLFPENIPEVESFEKLHRTDGIEIPSIEDIFSGNKGRTLADFFDLDMNLAAYSGPDEQFPKPDEKDLTEPEKSDQP